MRYIFIFKNRPLEITTDTNLISLFVLQLFALTTGRQRHDNLISDANGTNIQNLVFEMKDNKMWLFQSHRQNKLFCLMKYDINSNAIITIIELTIMIQTHSEAIVWLISSLIVGASSFISTRGWSHTTQGTPTGWFLVSLKMESDKFVWNI